MLSRNTEEEMLDLAETGARSRHLGRISKHAVNPYQRIYDILDDIGGR